MDCNTATPTPVFQHLLYCVNQRLWLVVKETYKKNIHAEYCKMSTKVYKQIILSSITDEGLYFYMFMSCCYNQTYLHTLL